jgi:hypothetical protein
MFLLKSNFVFCAGQKWILARSGPDPKQKQVLSQSAIVGILVTAILIVTVVAVTIYFVVRNRYSLLSKIFILFATRRFTAVCSVTAAIQYVHKYGHCSAQLSLRYRLRNIVQLRWLAIPSMVGSKPKFTDTDECTANILLPPSLIQHFHFLLVISTKI